MGLLFEVLSFSMIFFWAYFVCITKPPLGIYIYTLYIYICVGFDPVHFQLQLDPRMILSLVGFRGSHCSSSSFHFQCISTEIDSSFTGYPKKN